MNKLNGFLPVLLLFLLFQTAFLSGQNDLPMRLPDFSLKSTDGREVTPADYAGKIVLVNFWATWCPPCVVEIPDLIKIQESRKDLIVLGISVDIETDKVAPFVGEKKINYPVLYGNNDVVQAFGGIRFIPQSFLYDRSGRLVRKFEGIISEKELKKALKEIK
jgi:cytochrome c biogenesis protein CcmG/thiol:disulfide interchange protein DsbE